MRCLCVWFVFSAFGILSGCSGHDELPEKSDLEIRVERSRAFVDPLERRRLKVYTETLEKRNDILFNLNAGDFKGRCTLVASLKTGGGIVLYVIGDRVGFNGFRVYCENEEYDSLIHDVEMDELNNFIAEFAHLDVPILFSSYPELVSFFEFCSGDYFVELTKSGESVSDKVEIQIVPVDADGAFIPE